MSIITRTYSTKEERLAITVPRGFYSITDDEITPATVNTPAVNSITYTDTPDIPKTPIESENSIHNLKRALDVAATDAEKIAVLIRAVGLDAGS